LSGLRRISVTVPAEEAEQARAAMLDLFPEGFEETERATTLELAAYTDAAGATRLWRAFGDYTWAEVPGDWEDRWRRFHRPVQVGPVWVGPTWERPPAEGIPVVIDPGRAFGTGAHETTRLCLELLLELERGSLVDVGCGSGVLAVAATKLGYEPVVALDHDAVAVETARANAAANGADVDVRLADVLESPLPPTDAAVANISATAVEQLAEGLDAPRVVTSGYLASDTVSLRGYRAVERRTLGSWAADVWAAAG
jgi:ribosomal protein L11 methyltransferase